MRQKAHPIQRSWRRSMPLFRSFELAGLIWTFEHSGQRPRGRQKTEFPTTGRREGSSLTAAKEQASPVRGCRRKFRWIEDAGLRLASRGTGPKITNGASFDHSPTSRWSKLPPFANSISVKPPQGSFRDGPLLQNPRWARLERKDDESGEPCEGGNARWGAFSDVSNLQMAAILTTSAQIVVKTATIRKRRPRKAPSRAALFAKRQSRATLGAKAGILQDGDGRPRGHRHVCICASALPRPHSPRRSGIPRLEPSSPRPDMPEPMSAPR